MKLYLYLSMYLAATNVSVGCNKERTNHTDISTWCSQWCCVVFPSLSPPISRCASPPTFCTLATLATCCVATSYFQVKVVLDCVAKRIFSFTFCSPFVCRFLLHYKNCCSSCSCNALLEKFVESFGCVLAAFL